MPAVLLYQEMEGGADRAARRSRCAGCGGAGFLPGSSLSLRLMCVVLVPQRGYNAPNVEPYLLPSLPLLVLLKMRSYFLCTLRLERCFLTTCELR